MAPVFVAVALPLPCSCEWGGVAVGCAGEGEMAYVSLTVSPMSQNFGSSISSTKSRTSPAYTEMLPCERRVNTLKVCAFSSETGELLDSWPLLTDVHEHMGGGDSPWTPSRTLRVRAGEVTVCAVANGPADADCSNLSSLRNTQADFGTYTVTGETGAFALYGETTFTTTAGEYVNVGVTLRRLCARIALAHVENLVPASMGTVILEHFFLANAVGGGIRLGDGFVPSPVWCNRRGRLDETPLVMEHVIGSSSDAQLPSLTFSAQGQALAGGVNALVSPAVLYCAANSSSAEPDGFAPDWPECGQKTVAVACISIGGQLYRCPVTLPSVEPDTAYTVNLTVSGPAGSEPNGYPAKENMEMCVTITPFAPGSTLGKEL